MAGAGIASLFPFFYFNFLIFEKFSAQSALGYFINEG